MASNEETGSVTSDKMRTTSSVTNRSDPDQGTSEPFNYDEILQHLGQLGKFQFRSFLWLCLPAMFPGITVMSYIFVGAIPDYRCYVQGCDNVGGNDEFAPGWWGDAINSSYLSDPKCNKVNGTWIEPDQCILALPANETTGNDQEACDQWIYDQSIFHSTIVSEFDLSCEEEWKQPIPNVVYMVGTMMGSVTLGAISDRFGRRLAFTFNAVLLAAVTTASAFSPDFIFFSIMRFLSGVSAAGQFDVVFVWGVEAVGGKYRVQCGFFYQFMFVAGSLLLGLVAYFVRDWKTLQLVISVPMFALVGLYWIVPESTRWLISKEKYSQARKQISKASRINGKSVPCHLTQLREPVVYTVEDQSREEDKPKRDEEVKKKETLIDLFRSGVLLKRIVIIAAVWIALDMSYYGLTYSANNLSGDFFLNYELTMLVEIPAYLLGSFVVDWIGRRTTHCAGLVIGGAACLVTGLIPKELVVWQIIFSLSGKFFVAGVYAAVYTYTAELFPTTVRSAAVGVCSTSGRIGGILAPILADAGRTLDPSVPYISFATVNLIVGALCILLPETKNVPLPATIEDAINIEKRGETFLCCRSHSGSAEAQAAHPASELTNKSFSSESL